MDISYFDSLNPYIYMGKPHTGWVADKKENTEFYLEEGLISGEFRQYNAEGQLVVKKSYKEGKLHGPTTRYDPDGLIASTCLYEDDVPHGPQVIFLPNSPVAKVLSIHNYVKGVPLGGYYYFDIKEGFLTESGQLNEDGSYGPPYYWNSMGFVCKGEEND